MIFNQNLFDLVINIWDDPEMSYDIVAAIVTASGALILAGATYWFTKKRERDAELRHQSM